MTRKVFKETADILLSVEDKAQRRDLAERFADMFSEANPRFNWEAFLKACNL